MLIHDVAPTVLRRGGSFNAKSMAIKSPVKVVCKCERLTDGTGWWSAANLLLTISLVEASRGGVRYRQSHPANHIEGSFAVDTSRQKKHSRWTAPVESSSNTPWTEGRTAAELRALSCFCNGDGDP